MSRELWIGSSGVIRQPPSEPPLRPAAGPRQTADEPHAGPHQRQQVRPVQPAPPPLRHVQQLECHQQPIDRGILPPTSDVPLSSWQSKATAGGGSAGGGCRPPRGFRAGSRSRAPRRSSRTPTQPGSAADPVPYPSPRPAGFSCSGCRAAVSAVSPAPCFLPLRRPAGCRARYPLRRAVLANPPPLRQRQRLPHR